MIRFHYVNGTVIEDENTDWSSVIITLQRRGMRFYNNKQGILMPMNHATMTHVELIEEEEEDDVREGSESVSTEEEASLRGRPDGRADGESESSPERNKDAEVQDAEESVEEARELTEQEKKDAIIAHMKEMSECPHENHDIYYQSTSVGRSKKPAKRYFPVCAKCGVRERYVKASDLTDEQKENAKLWDR